MQAYRFGNPRQDPKSLLEAAAYGNVKAFQQFLAQGAKVDQRDAQGWTALHHAVGYGQQAGVDVYTGRAPVREMVDALLRAGAPLNAVSKAKMTALMQAVSAGHEDAARWLIEAGADLRPVDTVGGSALTLALWYEHCPRAFAQYLIQKGSPINLWDALWLSDTPRALALAVTADVNAKGPKDFTYLHLAAMLGNQQVVSALLQRRASPAALTDQRRTPLHLAIGGEPGNMIPSGQPYWHAYGPPAGRVPLLSLLLSGHAPRDARDNHGHTALACAVLAERPELTHFLIKAGANPNGKGHQDEPLLIQAMQQRSALMVKALLEDGADPRVKTTYGTTALEYTKGEPPELRRLVKAALAQKSPASKTRNR